MLGIHDFGLFFAAAILLILAPGQDTFYILGRSIAQGRRIGVASALGVSTGTLVHTFAAALGLSAIVATSATAFVVIKLAGAAYLVVLGLQALWKPAAALSPPPARGDAQAWRAFRQGLLTNLLNPKVALFFLAFLPQFVASDAPRKTAAFILLGLTFVAAGTIWVVVLALAASRVRGFFERRPGASTWIARAMGGLFIYLGLRLAASER